MANSERKGFIELRISLRVAKEFRSTRVQDSITDYWTSVPFYARQLAELNEEDVYNALKSTGGWEAEELQDKQQNLQRVFWIMANDAAEELADVAVRNYNSWRTMDAIP